MRITVDMNLCESHGQCVFAAPDVFSFDDEDFLVYEDRPADALRAHVRTAVSMCPVRAVSIIDEGEPDTTS
ncbi:ferredoxin [Embleya sp. NPDC056575]|uniref:ferredoxin n=1 Tax=unclassified Embleya TaxID=2699296 RepID=UPI00369BD05A